MEPDGTVFIVTLEIDATLRTAPGSSRAAETAQSGFWVFRAAFGLDATLAIRSSRERRPGGKSRP